MTNATQCQAPDAEQSPLIGRSDYWTWKRFKHEVAQLTPADDPATRAFGGDDEGWGFYEKLIRQGVIDLQQFIPSFRKRHETLYYPSDLAHDGSAGVGTLPPNAQLQDIWLFNFNEKRHYPVHQIAWERRMEMVHRHCGDILDSPYVVLTAASLAATAIANVLLLQSGLARHVALMAIDPQIQTFYLYPQLQGQWVLCVNWSGNKLDFKDDELVPFGEQAADAVAMFVLERIRRQLDRNLPDAAGYAGEYKTKRMNLYTRKQQEGFFK